MGVNAKEYGYFFNDNNGDRTYNAASFEDWLKPYFVSGVIAGGLQVMAQSTPDMTVIVTSGYANLDGKPAHWPDTNTLSLATASGVYNRIDTIVLRRDNTNRAITLDVVTGTASANPQPTAPTRTADIFELVLAQVLVGVGVTSITQANITDKRPDTTVCGYVLCTIDTPDFSELYAQFEAQAAQMIGTETEEFLEWFEEMRGHMDEDAAGYLQNHKADQTAIADEFDSSEVYQEGARCTHCGKYYKRKAWTGNNAYILVDGELVLDSDTPVAEPWRSDQWDEINVDDQLVSHNQAIAKKLLMPSSRITVPTGSSGYTGSLSGLTADYILLKWNFYTAASGGSVIAENNPPADMEWSTTTDSFTIKTGGSSSVYCQPVFGEPN